MPAFFAPAIGLLFPAIGRLAPPRCCLQHVGYGGAESLHVGFGHAGDIDAAGTDDVDAVLFF